MQISVPCFQKRDQFSSLIPQMWYSLIPDPYKKRLIPIPWSVIPDPRAAALDPTLLIPDPTPLIPDPTYLVTTLMYIPAIVVFTVIYIHLISFSISNDDVTFDTVSSNFYTMVE